MRQEHSCVSRRELARLTGVSEGQVRRLIHAGTLVPAVLPNGRLDRDKGCALVDMHKRRCLRLESRPAHTSRPQLSAKHITKYLRDNLARSAERYAQDVAAGPLTLEEIEAETGYTREAVLHYCKAGMQHAGGNPITGEGLLIHYDALFHFGACAYIACAIEGDDELYREFQLDGDD